MVPFSSCYRSFALKLSWKKSSNDTFFCSKRGIGWKDHHLSEMWQCFHSNNDVLKSWRLQSERTIAKGKRNHKFCAFWSFKTTAIDPYSALLYCERINIRGFRGPRTALTLQAVCKNCSPHMFSRKNYHNFLTNQTITNKICSYWLENLWKFVICFFFIKTSMVAVVHKI